MKLDPELVASTVAIAGTPPGIASPAGNPRTPLPCDHAVALKLLADQPCGCVVVSRYRHDWFQSMSVVCALATPMPANSTKPKTRFNRRLLRRIALTLIMCFLRSIELITFFNSCIRATSGYDTIRAWPGIGFALIKAYLPRLCKSNHVK